MNPSQDKKHDWKLPTLDITAPLPKLWSVDWWMLIGVFVFITSVAVAVALTSL